MKLRETKLMMLIFKQ